MLIIPCRGGYGAFPSAKIYDCETPGEFICNSLIRSQLMSNSAIVRELKTIEDAFSKLWVFPCTFVINVPEFRDLKIRCPYCDDTETISNVTFQPASCDDTYHRCVKCRFLWVAIVFGKLYEPRMRPFSKNVEPFNRIVYS